MITTLSINSFKSILDESFDLKPLTIITGVNASGKSSLLQALLLILSQNVQKNTPYLDKVIAPFTSYDDVFCRWSSSKEIKISLTTSKGYALILRLSKDNHDFPYSDLNSYSYEENFFYISANRTGQEEISLVDKNLLSGDRGQYLFGTYEKQKNKPVHKDLQHPKAFTPNLKAQLSYWLSLILKQDIELESEKITSDNVKNYFKLKDLGDVSLLQTGAGNSFLAKILILGLISKPGDLLLIENPELHLHPKAQSKLAQFYSFLSERSVQIIIETHSEHFINNLRFQVYSQELQSGSINLYYKASSKDPFIPMFINTRGHFINKEGLVSNYPTGFFDASLEKLLEIG